MYRKKQIRRLRHIVPAVMIACSVPVIGTLPYLTVEVSAAEYTGTEQIFSLVEGVDLSEPLDTQGFSLILTSSESALLEGDIIIAGEKHYGWLGDNKAVDLDTKEECVYEFNSEDAFYRFKKLNPEYQIPAGLEAVYQDKLSSVVLPDGFSWMADEEIWDVGDIVYKVSYKPSNTLKYRIVEDIPVTVSVKKKLVSPPMPDNILTTQYKTGLTLADVPLPSGWTFAEPGSALRAGKGKYKALFSGDTEHFEYDVTEKNVVVNVEKGYMTHPPLTYIRVPAGTYLDDSLLPNVDGGSYEWDTPEIVSRSGSYSVTFCPDDQSSYKNEAGLKIMVYASTALAEEAPKTNAMVSGNAKVDKTDVKTTAAPSTSTTQVSQTYGMEENTVDESEESETGSTQIKKNTSGSYLTAKTFAATNKNSADVVVKRGDNSVAVARPARTNTSDTEQSLTEEKSDIEKEYTDDAESVEKAEPVKNSNLVIAPMMKVLIIFAAVIGAVFFVLKKFTGADDEEPDEGEDMPL